jgi:hypothetical protein
MALKERRLDSIDILKGKMTKHLSIILKDSFKNFEQWQNRWHKFIGSKGAHVEED